MCRECFASYGSPTEVDAATLAAVDAIRELYVDHPTGGAFHVALDDWNLEQVPWCSSLKDEPGYSDVWDASHDRVAAALAALSKRQLGSALAIASGYVDDPRDVLDV